MKNSKFIITGFLQALGVAVYVTLVALFMSNVEKIFGNTKDTILAPISLLMLFVLSAATTGSLTLGRPLMLYFENRKAEGIKLFFFTLGWLFIITVILLAAQISFKK
jgi:ACR3 family arsenite efflux pump ArsB